ncbi:MAG TPA: hypothetical protein VFH27_18655 [Longimicrobiaceae bacterium]|nr:hypothetical protein [Longimicrobiaceae bacterium]
MRPAVPVLALAALLAACGNGTVDVPAGPDLDGTWVGATTTPVVTYRLKVQDDGGSLSGTGGAKGARDSVGVELDGEKSFRTVDFALKSTGFVDLTFHGTTNATADSIVGTVTGSGYSGQALVLRPVR